MRLSGLTRLLPSWQNALLALLGCGLLVLAFPPFELWFTAWFALVPLLWAIEREKASTVRSFVLGWLFGNVFFFATCWWLTFAPITYAGFPVPLAYFLLFCVTSVAAVFPALFASITSFLLQRFGSLAFLAVPFVWVFTEFLRYWLTGNNWNAIGYSQAFTSGKVVNAAQIGGVLASTFLVLIGSSLIVLLIRWYKTYRKEPNKVPFFPLAAFWSAGLLALADKQLRDDIVGKPKHDYRLGIISLFVFPLLVTFLYAVMYIPEPYFRSSSKSASVIAIQPNVPMSGLDYPKWGQLRQQQVELAEAEIRKLTTDNRPPTTVLLPESPMNFMYEDDPETQEFINGFAKRNNVSVLFNSAEPDASNGKFFNSAVMVGPEGKEVAQYDKIYLLPFGEAVPFPLEGILPGFVGNFSYGREYDLLPLGDAKAGVMICFESHFGQLSREYVRNGADVIIEMTNDGYLGPTPVLRQHLANAVFRAVETNRPVLRVTNVGITAYINERGQVLDPAESYVEATRVWSVAKSDGSQTFYVKYGDWFTWLCSAITLALLMLSVSRKRSPTATDIKA